MLLLAAPVPPAAELETLAGLETPPCWLPGLWKLGAPTDPGPWWDLGPSTDVSGEMGDIPGCAVVVVVLFELLVCGVLGELVEWRLGGPRVAVLGPPVEVEPELKDNRKKCCQIKKGPLLHGN